MVLVPGARADSSAEVRALQGGENGWEMMQDLASWTMLRRLLTQRPVEEMMVDFWSNLLHVASPPERVGVAGRVPEADPAERLGRFNDILRRDRASGHGPVSQQRGVDGEAINENLGRELLECHTVGVGANYTEEEVINSARILTGFHVDMANWAQSYVPAEHWVGKVKVLGFRSTNPTLTGGRCWRLPELPGPSSGDGQRGWHPAGGAFRVRQPVART